MKPDQCPGHHLIEPDYTGKDEWFCEICGNDFRVTYEVIQ